MFSMFQKKINLKKKQLQIFTISSNDNWINQAIKWSHIDSVGSIGITNEEEKFIRDNSRDFYIVFYGSDKTKQAVGMFMLCDFKLDKKLKKCTDDNTPSGIKELDFFYIIPEMRNYGIGSLILDEIRQMTKLSGSKLIILQTIHPGINKFYEKNGAKIVCDADFYDEEAEQYHPSSLMKMSP